MTANPHDEGSPGGVPSAEAVYRTHRRFDRAARLFTEPGLERLMGARVVVFGLGGVMFQSAYCTAKAGVKGFTEALRMELMDTNIKTTVVHPGGINTNIARNAPPKGRLITADMHQQAIKAFEKNAPTSSAEAARQILNAVERNKERLVIGMDGKILSLLTRLFPVAFTKIMRSKLEEVMTNPYKS